MPGASSSGVVDKWANYTNFSGDSEPGGTPIPFKNNSIAFIVEYGEDFYGYLNGAIDGQVDVSFAGWVGFPIEVDVYSTVLGITQACETEVATTSGTILPIYGEVFSSSLLKTSLSTCVYSSMLTSSGITFDVSLIPGGIDHINTDIYSTSRVIDGLFIEVDLFPIKIYNFFPEIGEYTTTSGAVSVDIVDDSCPISVSGTYLKVDDQIVPVTLSGIALGYRLFYDPADNFSSLQGPTVFTVHAENECGDVLEKNYYLTYGYLIEYTNTKDAIGSIDFGFENKVAVRVTAEDYASCPSSGELSWEFGSKPQFNTDLSASIIAKPDGKATEDFTAEIYPVSLAYFYGKDFKVVVTARDFAGNYMEPLIINYRIEDKPS